MTDAWTVGSDFDVLRDVVARLAHAGVDYFLTGSTVMSYCAAPRDTRDFDVVVELGARRIDDVVALFADFALDRAAVSDAVQRRGSFNLIHPETITKIDLIIPRQVDLHRSIMARRIRAEVHPGTTVWICSCEDLVLSKLLFSTEPPNSRDDPSPYQLRDIAAILDAGMRDLPYIEEWVRRLGLQDVWAHRNRPR